MSDEIPIEVQMDIVRRLPVKRILQCRSVSKSWKSAIDMNFAFTPVPTNLSFADLNPIRRSVGTLIPYLTIEQAYEKRLLAFGIRPDNLDPTILKIAYPFNPEYPWCVLLFSFNTKQWKQLDDEFLPRQSIRLKKSSQAVVNGHIFWCAYESLFANDGSEYKSYMMVSFNLEIPIEVQMDIVRRLPVKRILQCRSVSKRWKSAIDTLYFTIKSGVRQANNFLYVLQYRQGFKGYMHYMCQNFAFAPVHTHLSFSHLKPIGWSHGVWAFSYGPILPHYTVFVCNPSIRRSVCTLIPYLTIEQAYEKRLLAFGIRPDNLDPTILKIAYPFNPENPWCVLLFSFNSKRWKHLDEEFLPRQSIRLKKSSQAVVDGHILWCAYESLFANDGCEYKSYMMMSFNLVTQCFHVLGIPAQLLAQLPVPFYVSNLRDKVVVSGNLNVEDHFVFCVWTLEVVGGSIQSFQCLTRIPTPCPLKLIGFDNTNNPILEVQSPEGYVMNLAGLPVVLEQAKVFKKKGIDPTTYAITFKNEKNVPAQGGLFGDCGIWACIFLYRLSHGKSLDVDNPVQVTLAYREHMSRFFYQHRVYSW
ncbi:F-box domain-containing protein [Artemisia annua]|uniref:F-box domain-containing protein n=1 Tax=Artemisia annua TaxID=35608 RepID=A0A2U1MND6_ARTAN|nr:F-box domain-containing protein [Artemisia annua]